MLGAKSIGLLRHPGYNDIGTIVSAAVGFMGASEQADAAESAASSSAAASKYATDLQKQIYEQTRADQAPWRQTGQASLNMLANYMGLPNQYAQYYGMSDDQIRNALLSQYTRTQQGTQATTQPQSAANPFGLWAPMEGEYGGTGAPITATAATSPTSTIDESGLAARLGEIRSGLQGYDPNAANRGSLLRDFSMSDYEADPGYAFRLSEGMKALERSAAARGGLLSGATMKGMERYGQDLASHEYQNAFNRYQSNQANKFNRLASIAGVGQTANQALQTAGSNYAGNVGNLAMANAANQGNAALVAGQSRASAYGGIGNALGNLNLGNIYKGSTVPPTGFGYGEPLDWGVSAYNN